MNRISLSEKEVAQIHLMLTTLPLPPIPITLQLDTTKMEDEETKTALDMALASVMQDKRTQDGIVNSHSVFAAMSFFLKWSKYGSDPAVQANIMHVKDGILLMLIQQVIEYHCAHPDTATYKDEEILQIFIAISQAWINSYLPPGVTCAIGPAPKQENIGYEDNLHISMTHYCYAQGVLYNSKNAQVSCETHKLLCETLQRQRAADVADGCGEETEVGNRHTQKMEPEHVAIAQLYSQFPYHKLMVLCFNRLLQDSLHGHNYVPNEDTKQEIEHNTKELLRLSFDNYKSILTTPASASSCVTDNGDAISIQHDKVSSVVAPVAEARSATLAQGENTPENGENTPEKGASTPETPEKSEITLDHGENTPETHETPEKGENTLVQGENTTCSKTATPIPTKNDVTSLFKTPEEGVGATESEFATPTTTKDVASLFETLEHSPETTKREIADRLNVCDPTRPLVVAGALEEKAPDTDDTFCLGLVDSTVPVTRNTKIEVQSVIANYQPAFSELDETRYTACNTSPRSKTHTLNPRDLGGYKSIFGIFILEIIAFLDNPHDPRLLQNMTTNLRHLHELLQQDCAITRQALTIINIPTLLHLLRNTPSLAVEIEAQLCDIEQTL